MANLFMVVCSNRGRHQLEHLLDRPDLVEASQRTCIANINSEIDVRLSMRKHGLIEQTESDLTNVFDRVHHP